MYNDDRANEDPEDRLVRRMQRQMGQAPMPPMAPPMPPPMAPPVAGAGDFNGRNGQNIIDPNDPRARGGVTQVPPGVPPAGGGVNRSMPVPGVGGVPPSAGAPPVAGGLGGRAAAASSAAAAGFKDIENTDPLKTGAYMGNLEGFNTGGWGSGERGSGTMKNKFGQIASRYDPKAPGAARALVADEDFQSFWPGATVGNPPKDDMIDFDGDGPMKPVDVLRAATAGGAGEGWQWDTGDEGGAGGGAGGAGGAGGFDGGMDLHSLLGNEDPLDDIMKRLEDLQSGQTPDAEQESLMALLRDR